jgi:hypothetical protein
MKSNAIKFKFHAKFNYFESSSEMDKNSTPQEEQKKYFIGMEELNKGK